MFNPADTLKFLRSRWVAAGFLAGAAVASILIPESQFQEWKVPPPSKAGWQYLVAASAGALFFEAVLLRAVGVCTGVISFFSRYFQRQRTISKYMNTVCRLALDERELLWAIYRNGGILSAGIENKHVQSVSARGLIYQFESDQSDRGFNGFYKLGHGGMEAMEMLEAEIKKRLKYKKGL